MLALLLVGEKPRVQFQTLFLQRLPTDMRDHLVAANLETPREMVVVLDMQLTAIEGIQLW